MELSGFYSRLSVAPRHPENKKRNAQEKRNLLNRQ